jgi:hypothetical protein
METNFYKNQTSIACYPQNILSYANFTEKCVQAVYSNLIALISEYAESHCFTRTPDSSDSLLHFRCKIDKIESMIHQIYENPQLVSDLLSVTCAIKRMVCTCNFPGVPSSWYKINPNLRFYSASFKILIESPEIYEQIKNDSLPLSLDYYPDCSEIPLYHEYFSKMAKANEDGNYHYSEDDFFQFELIETIKIIFRNLNRQP